MPGLDPSQVSSNWKLLQKELEAGKKGEPKQNGLKRKRPQATEKPVKAFKMSRIEHVNKPNTIAAKTKMGQNGTKEAARHETLAQDHGIGKEDISAAYGTANGSRTPHQDEINGGVHSSHKTGKYVALDCEMVGTGPPPHHDHVLARASMVNFHGEQIYDSYVLPPDSIKIEDYRTHVSGIKAEHLKPGYARPFAQVQKDISFLLDGRLLIGHALRNDLQVLMLSHPQRDIRDTFRHPKFREENYGKPPSLRNLAEKELGMKIQMGEHSSVEDARATMMIFRKEKAGFEEDHRRRYGANATSKPVPKSSKSKQARETTDASDQEEEEGSDDEADMELLAGEESSGPNDNGSVAAEQTTNNRPKKKPKKKKRTKRK